MSDFERKKALWKRAYIVFQEFKAICHEINGTNSRKRGGRKKKTMPESQHIYILVAHDGVNVKECFAVTDKDEAWKYFEILQETYGRSTSCIASRAIDDVPQRIKERAFEIAVDQAEAKPYYVTDAQGNRLRHG